jgi:hypothetical protein
LLRNAYGGIGLGHGHSLKIINNLMRFLLIALLLFKISISAKEWTEPYCTYLFAPGLWSSEHQAAKYCSEYTASTGQKVMGKHGYELMNGKFCHSCNFAEISLVSLQALLDSKNSWSPRAMLMNQLYKLGHSIITTSNNRYSISIEGQSKNGLTLNPYTLNLFHLNFGQMIDVNILSKKYDHCCQNRFLPEDMVLFGTSRGAAAIIHFMALEYLKKPQKRVKAIILEGCFDSVAQLTRLSYPISLITAYKHDGIAPISSPILKAFIWICNFYSIPVLFVTSEKDQRVPPERTFTLCSALKEGGLEDLYLFILKNSTHSAYLKDDKEDAESYEALLHAFYEEYHLSCIASLAQKGHFLLDLSKIT